MTALPALDGELYSESGMTFNESLQKWRPLPGAREKGLSVVGSAVYSEHPSTNLLTCSYDLLDGRGVRRWRPGWPLPHDLFRHVQNGYPLESHGAMFEGLWWVNVAMRLYGWPALPWGVQRCSMATARVNSLPGKLEILGDVLRLDTRKDAEGKRLIKKFCIPRDPTKANGALRIRPEDDPEDFERLCLYCDQDVRTEQAVSDVVPPMSPSELECWQLNQAINWRGLGIDRAGVRDCIAVMESCMDRYGAECLAITGGIGPTQVQALLGWVAGRMHGPTFTRVSYQYDPDLDDDVPF